MEELIKGHFHFFREYCEHRKSHTSVLQTNQLTKYLLGLAYLPLEQLQFLLGQDQVFLYMSVLTCQKALKIIFSNIYYFTIKEFCSLVLKEGKHRSVKYFTFFTIPKCKPQDRLSGGKFLLQKIPCKVLYKPFAFNVLPDQHGYSCM